MNNNEMNNGLLETLNSIIPLYEKMMEYTNEYEASSYMKTIEIAMNKKYNAFSICLVFDLMLSEFLNNCRISLVDLVLERDKDAVDCVAISKDILDKLRKSGYYDLKETAYKKMQSFLDETYRKGTKIDVYFEKGEKLYEIIESHFSTIDRMELHQFIKGKETNEKPLFLKDINCFKNMNEAIQVMNTIPVNFIGLVGIKDDASNEYGYFSYIIKNGESVYALSDINRSKGTDCTFTRHRSVYGELMPYVHLGEFQYKWYWTDFMGNQHPLNTDKYHVAVNNKNWQCFTTNELEDDEILLQYFMFDYVKNLLFVEKPKVEELSYTTQTIALTYKGKTINKKQLPILTNNLNSIEVNLPNFVDLFEEVYNEMYSSFKEDLKENYKYRKEHKAFIGIETSRRWEINQQACETVKEKIKKTPLDLLYFEYDKENIMKVSGETEQLSESWENRKLGISSHFFGTDSQYREYSRSVIKENFKRMINEEYTKILQNKKMPHYKRFLKYLISEKFADVIVEKTLLDALTNREFSEIQERAYIQDSFSKRKCWESSGSNIWIQHLSWREEEVKKGCVITGAKNCSYKISLRIKHFDTMKKIWAWLEKEDVPDYLKINDYYTDTHGLGYDLKMFENTITTIYWISKAGLKKFCKEHDLDYDDALDKVIKTKTNKERW